MEIYMVQAKRYVLDTELIDLCGNHICLSDRDSAKQSPKETKEDKGRNIEKLLDWVTEREIGLHLFLIDFGG